MSQDVASPAATDSAATVLSRPVTVPSGRFSTLHEIAQLLSSSLELDVVLQRVMDVVVAVTGAERGFILLADAQGALQPMVARNLNREEIDSRESGVSLTLCERVFRSGDGELVGDAMADERTAAAQSVLHLRLRSILCAPLSARGKTIGVVYLDNRIETSRFSYRELQFIETVGEQASIAIENARLYEDLRQRAREVADLKAYQDSILRSVGSAIVGLDLQGRVLSLNRAAEQLFRPSPDAVGQPYLGLFGDALSGRLLRRFTAAALGRSGDIFTVATDIHSEERHLRCEVAPLVHGDGSVDGMIFVAEDETARVLAERARQQEEAERRRIRDLFGRFVAEPVVEQIIASPERAQLGGSRRHVTVVFADIRGYTTFSEHRTPEEVVQTLSRYLAIATDAILEEQGTLDKFMGDGVMAVFNAPLDHPNHELAAVRAAWRMQQRAAQTLEGVTFGVGVNTGDVLAGNLGTDRFRNYLCIGDATNVASRVESNSLGGEVLITDTTYAAVRDYVRVESRDPMHVKGREQPVTVYRVLDVTLD